MESNSKSSNIKSKRSNRKFSVKTDNLNDKENGKHSHRKLMLKRRGLYVERNPTKLTIDEVFERKTSAKSSQRDCASSVLTSSIVGNQRSFIHEEIKTKRRVGKRNSTAQRAIANCKIDLPKNREKIKSKVSKEEIKDDIVYLLQSNKRRDLKTSDSFRSKRSSDFNGSTFSIKRNENHTSNIPNGSFAIEEGIDRIAAQILQDWMTDKEQKTKLENPVKTEEGLHNISLNLPVATEKNVAQDIPSISKEVKPDGTILNSSIKRITFDVSDHTDISIPRDTPRKFHITECDSRIEEKENERKRPRIKVKPVKPKFNKLPSEPRVFSSSTKKAVRRNGKEFLDIIKKELEKCRYLPEEPRSMFDALKIVARNKHLSKRRISLYSSDTDCQLEPSKLLHTTKLYSSRLKYNSMKCPIDLQTKKKRHKKLQRTLRLR